MLCYWLTHHTRITLVGVIILSAYIPKIFKQRCILLRSSHWSDFPVDYLTWYFFFIPTEFYKSLWSTSGVPTFTYSISQECTRCVSQHNPGKNILFVVHTGFLVFIAGLWLKLEAKQGFTNTGMHFSNGALILFSSGHQDFIKCNSKKQKCGALEIWLDLEG